MNETRHHADDLDWDDAQWCQLYLLGELTSNQSGQFEQRLGQSPELAEQLLLQADLLLAIAPETYPPINTPSVQPRSTVRRNRTQTLAVVAIAASLIIVVTAGWYQQRRSSEELLIARAWVETFLNDPVDSSEAVLTIDESPVDHPVDDDFDWMFVAVSIDDSLTQPASNQPERDLSNEG